MSQGFYGFPNILGLLRATAFRAVGKAGAEAGATLAGGTTSGAPTSGEHDVGELVVDQGGGTLWICTVGGTPGTWVQAGAGSTSPLTTTGDLWGYGAGSADARVPVGADGLALVADSSQTLGVRWGAPQPSSLLVLLPNPYAFVDSSPTDNGQPPDFIMTAAGDVIGVGGL